MTKTITFQPEPGIREMLQQVKETVGSVSGLINETLRRGLAEVIRDRADRLHDAAKKETRSQDSAPQFIKPKKE